MIKFESYQAINNHNNNNTANNGKLDSAYTHMTILFWFEKSLLKRLAVALFVI